jgi:hypothetical protein
MAHHSDPQVDVTTTVRQHPVESVIRYTFLASFAFAFGASPLAFTIYRVWSALHGMCEHANIRLPQWLDTAITFVFSSPNMHKIHHSRHQRFTDRNYTNIFSIWDRLGGTFTPSKHGRDIVYGLEGEDVAERQSTLGLLKRRSAGRKALTKLSPQHPLPRGDDFRIWGRVLDALSRRLLLPMMVQIVDNIGVHMSGWLSTEMGMIRRKLRVFMRHNIGIR